MVDSEPRDHFFDPWRVPITVQAKGLISAVLSVLIDYERRHHLRQRQRRPDDQKTFEETISAVISDVVCARLSGQHRVAVTRSNQRLGRGSRYRSPALGKTLPAIMDSLASPELRLLTQTLGGIGEDGARRQTVVSAGERLVMLIDAYQLTTSDFGRSPYEEVIVLRERSGDDPSDTEELEYEDTPETLRMRAEIVEINAWIASADIRASRDDGEGPLPTHSRRLRRLFRRRSFENGGRLHGGFWQTMKKADRPGLLWIAGERTVELDYGQMAPRLLYASVGAVMDGDAYSLPGLPDHQHNREGIKKLLNALLASERPLTRKPKDTKQLLPDEDVSMLVDALKRRHQPIAHLFGTGVGHRLERSESDLMVDVLLTAKARGIVALPIHDAIIVAGSAVGEAKLIMEEVFLRRTGHDAVVRPSSSSEVSSQEVDIGG